jgi:prevent-host-death family protein
MSEIPNQISAADFKAKCLKLMDSVERDRIQVIITKRGRPVARLVPYEENPPSLFGFMAGTGTISGDIVASLDETWHAEHE